MRDRTLTRSSGFATTPLSPSRFSCSTALLNVHLREKTCRLCLLKSKIGRHLSTPFTSDLARQLVPAEQSSHGAAMSSTSPSLQLICSCLSALDRGLRTAYR